MSQPVIRISPIATQFSRRNPQILLCGPHQPTLLRYLDGRPRRNGGPHAFLIKFVEPTQSLAQFKDNQFDLAVVLAPATDQVEDVVRHLTRIARQGLITSG